MKKDVTGALARMEGAEKFVVSNSRDVRAQLSTFLGLRGDQEIMKIIRFFHPLPSEKHDAIPPPFWSKSLVATACYSASFSCYLACMVQLCATAHAEAGET